MQGPAQATPLTTSGTKDAEASGLELQRQRLRAMTIAQRLHVAAQLYWSARQFKEAYLRSLNPDLSDAEIKARVTRAFLDVRD